MPNQDRDRRQGLGPNDLGLPQDPGAPAEPAAPADPNADLLAELNALRAQAGLEPIPDPLTIRIAPEPEDFMPHDPKRRQGFRREPEFRLVDPYKLGRDPEDIKHYPEKDINNISFSRKHEPESHRDHSPRDEPLVSGPIRPIDWDLTNMPFGSLKGSAYGDERPAFKSFDPEAVLQNWLGRPISPRTEREEPHSINSTSTDTYERQAPKGGVSISPLLDDLDRRTLAEAALLAEQGIIDYGMPDHFYMTPVERAKYEAFVARQEAEARLLGGMPPDFDLSDPMRGWPMKPGTGGIVDDELKRMVAEETGNEQQGRDTIRPKVFRESVPLPKAKLPRNEQK